MSETLILNSDGQPLSMLPLSTISWKDAMRLTFLDKVIVQEYYDDWVVHSATREFPVPSVVMIKSYVKRRSNVCLTRSNLYLRDGYRCQYCGNRFSHQQLTYDHLIPSAKGGDHEWSNLVAACKPCNGRKGDKLHEPINQPFEPTYWDMLNRRLEAPVIIRHYSWKRWIPAGKGGFQLVPVYT